MRKAEAFDDVIKVGKTPTEQIEASLSEALSAYAGTEVHRPARAKDRGRGDVGVAFYATGRDPAVIQAYENDPLVYRGPIPTGSAMGTMGGKLYDMVPQITLPALIMKLFPTKAQNTVLPIQLQIVWGKNSTCH